MNWETNNRNRLKKEYSSDDLHPTGSYRDQKRYFENYENYQHQQSLPFSEADSRNFLDSQRKCLSKHKYRNKNYKYKNLCVSYISNRDSDYKQLSLYINHALSENFSKKWPLQKSEIGQYLQKLIYKCESWGKNKSPTDQQLIDLANNTLIGIKNYIY
jgi:hypothetical protein